MKIFEYFFAVLVILLLAPLAAAHEDAGEMPKTTPDHLFYGLSVALDKVSLALTSDKHAKARKGLSIAHERLLEINAMREAGKLDKAQKSADNYAATMDVVAAAIEHAPEASPEKDAEDIGMDDAGLSEVTDEASDVTGKLASDLEVDNLTELQKARIAKINEKIAHHQKAIAQLEERKSKLGKKLHGEKLKEIEEMHANITKREAKAQVEIAEAEKLIVEATPLAAGLPRGDELLANANKHLFNARTALTNKKYGEAFGQANAAGHIAKAIAKRSEQLAKRAEHKEERAENKTAREAKQAEKHAENANKSDMGRHEEEGNPAQKAIRSGKNKTTNSEPENSRSSGY